MDTTTKNIYNNWEQMIEDGEEILVQNCKSISRYGTDPEKGELIENMRNIMKDICDVNRKFVDQKKSLTWCRDIQDPENIDYNQEYEKKLSELTKGKKYNIETDAIYKNFMKRIEEHISDDFEFETSENNFMDPISRQCMKQPVKSKLCGHIFDKESIESMFTAHHTLIRCPYVGCQNKLRKTDIEKDEHLTQQFQLFLKSQTQN